jgi:hypothetical protein
MSIKTMLPTWCGQFSGSWMTSRVIVTPQPEKTLGYFTVEKDTVHITSVNGTIDLVLPRIGKDATGKERPRDFAKEAKIHYPITSPEWTDYFISWIWRVQHVRDSGTFPQRPFNFWWKQISAVNLSTHPTPSPAVGRMRAQVLY